MSLFDQIEQVRAEFVKEIGDLEASDVSSLGQLRIRYLGRKGLVAELFARLPKAPTELRPRLGRHLNALKEEILSSLDSAISQAGLSEAEAEPVIGDLTLPGVAMPVGTLHPVQQTLEEVKRIFASIAFSVAYGPEIDDDYHNFEALNIPKHHPARDMQDTFYVSDDVVLRTHTSNTQIHVMENQHPPLRVICPGRVYRNEAISVRSYCLFYQVEGLYVNRNVSFAEMKGTLEYFCRQFFGPTVHARFRPSFFPFTEPSAEVDISCILCDGGGCPTCKKTGWLEILGCGMVDPEVFRNVGYDPDEWTGYAFGMGLERLTMLKYRIDDIRLFFNGDVHFLRQFA